MNLTLVTGWTGLISFFANIGNVATNTGALRRLSELAPAERPPGAPSPGRSVFLRPGIWVLAAALGAIGFAIAHAKPTPTWKTGACVRVEGAKASPVDCAADHDATVLDVVATGQPCPPGGRGVVVHDRKRYCIG